MYIGTTSTQALIEFENVLSMEPKNYVGDNLARITDMYRVAQYNVACCYSVLGSTEAGLDALNNALKVGFDDYAKVRSDPNLANLRESPKYKAIVDKYDEPVINEEAIKCVFCETRGVCAHKCAPQGNQELFQLWQEVMFLILSIYCKRMQQQYRSVKVQVLASHLATYDERRCRSGLIVAQHCRALSMH